MEVNYQQSLDFGPILTVRLIYDCDLYVQIYIRMIMGSYLVASFVLMSLTSCCVTFFAGQDLDFDDT